MDLFYIMMIFIGLICLTAKILRCEAFSIVFFATNFFVFALMAMCEVEESYKKGQIDAFNGKQNYHLTTQPDKSQKWEKKEAFPD